MYRRQQEPCVQKGTKSRSRSRSTTPSSRRKPRAVNHAKPDQTGIVKRDNSGRRNVGTSRGRVNARDVDVKSRERSWTPSKARSCRSWTPTRDRSNSASRTVGGLSRVPRSGSASASHTKKGKKKAKGKANKDMVILTEALKILESENKKLRLALEDREIGSRRQSPESFSPMEWEPMPSPVASYVARGASKSSSVSSVATMATPPTSSQRPPSRRTAQAHNCDFGGPVSRVPLRTVPMNFNRPQEPLSKEPTIPSIAITAATPPFKRQVDADPDMFYAAVTQTLVSPTRPKPLTLEYPSVTVAYSMDDSTY